MHKSRTYICNMSMAKFKPYRIVILQKNLSLLWRTTGFARNLGNTVDLCLVTSWHKKFTVIREGCGCYFVNIFISLHVQQIMTHGIISPFMNHGSYLQNQNIILNVNKMTVCQKNVVSWWPKNAVKIPDQ